MPTACPHVARILIYTRFIFHAAEVSSSSDTSNEGQGKTNPAPPKPKDFQPPRNRPAAGADPETPDISKQEPLGTVSLLFSSPSEMADPVSSYKTQEEQNNYMKGYALGFGNKVLSDIDHSSDALVKGWYDGLKKGSANADVKSLRRCSPSGRKPKGPPAQLDENMVVLAVAVVLTNSQIKSFCTGKNLSSLPADKINFGIDLFWNAHMDSFIFKFFHDKIQAIKHIGQNRPFTVADVSVVLDSVRTVICHFVFPPYNTLP